MGIRSDGRTLFGLNTVGPTFYDSTFKINATVNCIGECGNITAFALYNNTISAMYDGVIPKDFDLEI